MSLVRPVTELKNWEAVSYTHLVFTSGHIHSEVPRQRLPSVFTVNDADAVSYTHLDVYKRQRMWGAAVRALPLCPPPPTPHFPMAAVW